MPALALQNGAVTPGEDRFMYRAIVTCSLALVAGRVRALAQVRGKTKEETDEFVQQFAPATQPRQDPRICLPTALCSNTTPPHEQVASYIREGQKWSKSGLKGVGF